MIPIRPAERGNLAKHTRKGIALWLVLLVLIVLGTLAFRYAWMASSGRAVVFRFEQSGIARDLADSASLEGLAWLQKRTASPETPESRWLLERSPTPLPLPVPMTLEQAGRSIGGDFAPLIETEARCLDFRGESSMKNRYGPGEGVGTLEISVRVRISSPSGGGKDRADVHLSRFHDFKVADIVSPRSNVGQRDSYFQGFILDFAFFLRDGVSEFRSTLGANLNSRGTRLQIIQSHLDPAHRGKVFIGGTEDQAADRLVFLNIDEARGDLIPSLPRKVIRTVGYDELRILFPRLRYYEGKHPLLLPVLRKLRGIFEAANVPLVRNQPAASDPVGICEDQVRTFLRSVAKDEEANSDPGLDLVMDLPALLSDPAQADSVLEGRLRQRFIHFVTFRFDISGIVDPTTLVLEPDDRKLLDSLLPCTPPPSPPLTNTNLRDFLEKLPEVNGTPPDPGLSIISRFDTDFLYRPGLTMSSRLRPDSFAVPRFFNASGRMITAGTPNPGGMEPFAHVNLWGYRMTDPVSLEEIGVLDRKNRKINLRGIKWTDGMVSLGDPGGPTSIEGQGILISKGGFRILGPLRKSSPEALCILFTHGGDIEVDTDQPVESSLIAIPDGTTGGEILPLKTLDLFGAFAARTLSLNRWKGKGIHKIRYDPLLKRDSPLRSIVISPAVSFHRITEGI